jgi:hypothetical protein
MTSAPLVIDIQESFRRRPSWSDARVVPYSEAQNALIDGFLASTLPIVRVGATAGVS